MGWLGLVGWAADDLDGLLICDWTVVVLDAIEASDAVVGQAERGFDLGVLNDLLHGGRFRDGDRVVLAIPGDEYGFLHVFVFACFYDSGVAGNWLCEHDDDEQVESEPATDSGGACACNAREDGLAKVSLRV